MSLYQAYQAYERRVGRGEFSVPPARIVLHPQAHERLLAWLGDLMIRTGLGLRRRYTAGKSMAWSPLTGSKQ